MAESLLHIMLKSIVEYVVVMEKEHYCSKTQLLLAMAQLLWERAYITPEEYLRVRQLLQRGNTHE